MKLIEALEAVKRTPQHQSAVLQVHLACGFTPLHFLTFLDAHLRHQFPDRKVVVRTGLFGDLAGNLERLENEPFSAVAAVMEWPDLDPRLGIRRLGGWGPGQLHDLIGNVRDQAARISDILERIGRKGAVALALPTLPLPPLALTPTWQSSSFENHLREAVASFAAQVSGFQGVRIVSSQRLDQLSPPSARFDVKSEVNTGFPYSISHADVLAGLMARIIRNRLPKKGLITDLDDTLWKGILGEDNVEGIAWDLDHYAQAHGLYQQLLASLAEAGILIAIASKNDPALVEEAFQRAKPILPRERIFPLEAGWGAKSESVSRILQAWNIGADSVVFVDDNPLDLAEVKAAHPEIQCLAFPRDDESSAYQLLQDLRDLFGKQSISGEDAIRLESLRASRVAAEATRSQGTSPEHFLQQAEGKLTLSFAKDSPDPRALELINKTNQFNLNGKRHTEASWNEYLSDIKAFLLLASYEDKFGPLGKIAVVAGRQEETRLWIDRWVMSCRAFSRRIEHGCLLYLFRKFNAEEATFDFVATTRNGPLQDFFAGLMGKPPSGAFSISRWLAEEKCPKVYAQIQEHPRE